MSALDETWFEAVLVGTIMAVFLVRRQWAEAVFVLAAATTAGASRWRSL